MPLITPFADRDASRPLRLAALISGGGTTVANLADKIAAGQLDASIAAVIASNDKALARFQSRNLNLPSRLVRRKDYNSPAQFSDVLWRHVRDAGAELVVCAGFLSMIVIPPDYLWRVVNIHPALLPAFGGHGMFGHHVHEAVLAAGCKVSGCTVHFCDASYDTGPIIVQRTCAVLEDDTADTLAARVFAEECQAYPQAVQLVGAGRVCIVDGRTRIAAPDA